MSINLASERNYIPINRILPDLGQPRRRYAHENLEELAQSFKLHGQVSFPMVEQITGREYRKYLEGISDVDVETKKRILAGVKENQQYYFLVVGHRRWLAAKLAGYKELGVDVLDNGLSLLERRLVQLDEDSQLQLTPARKAEEIVRLLKYENAERALDKKGPVSVADFSVYAGVSEDMIRNALRYSKLSPKVKKFVEQGNLAYEKAVILSLLPSRDDQYRYAARYGKKEKDEVKRIVYKRISQINEKNPEIIKKHGLSHIIGLISKGSDAGEFNLKSDKLTNASAIEQERLRARELRKQLFVAYKLSKVDRQYRRALSDTVHEKAGSVISAADDLERRLSGHTQYMQKLSEKRIVNGNGASHDTIDTVMDLIENKTPTELNINIRNTQTQTIPLKYIFPDPKNPRGKVTKEEIVDLSEAIKREGRLLNPLLVEKVGPKKYILVFGHRRREACKLANVKDVPVIVLTDLPPKLRLQLQKFENSQAAFSESERARALVQIFQLSGYKGVDELIAGMKISRKTGMAALKYETAVSPQVKKLVEEDLMPYSSALLFSNPNLGISQDEQVDLAYSAILAGEVSGNKMRERIAKFSAGKNQQDLFDTTPDPKLMYQRKAEDFSRLLEGIVQTFDLFWTDSVVKDVISKDEYTMRYIFSIRKILNDMKKRNGHKK